MKETVVNNLTYNCLLYYPEKIYSNKYTKFPFLLFLHGSGECGDDLNTLKKTGLPEFIENGAEYPFIISAPQCPHDQWWDHDKLFELLKVLIQNNPVEKKRIYMTGLSMGGSGVWAFANAHTGIFAAIAPICGPKTDINPGHFINLPVWCFHGEDDEKVPVDDSIKMIKKVRDAGCSARFTVYRGTGHDSWTETYKKPELYEWLLGHTNESIG